MAEDKPANVRELIEQGYAFPALLPKGNGFLLNDRGVSYKAEGGVAKLDSSLNDRLALVDLSLLDSLDGYSIPVIDKDYTAKTALMWNALYEKLDLPIRNIMLVASPRHSSIIFEAFRQDPKYIGGGLGAGFKEKMDDLDRVEPSDLKSVNIAVKDQGALVGYNTDAPGFVRSLEEKFGDIGKEIRGSNFVLLGAGGVAKEVSRLIASKGANRISILNRKYEKAVELAHSLNEEFGRPIAAGDGEHIIRGHALNSYVKPDAIINLTNKGSDGPLEEYAAFHHTRDRGENESASRVIARELSKLNPGVIIADINLTRGQPLTLSIADNEGLEHLIDGNPMVVNQAAPAYVYVQNAHPNLHNKKVSEEEALEVFREAAS